MQLKRFFLLICAISIALFAIQCRGKKNNEAQINLTVLNSISNKLLPGANQCIPFDTLHILAYDINNLFESRAIYFSDYFPLSDTLYKLLLHSLGTTAFQNKNLIAYAYCPYQSRKVLFTMPVYSKDKLNAVVCTRIICGPGCSETFVLLMEYKNSVWEINSKNRLAIE